jgi:hypothetical protein
VRRLLDATLKIDHRRTLPKYGFGTFRRAYRQLAARQAQYSEQVAFSRLLRQLQPSAAGQRSYPRAQRDGHRRAVVIKKNAAACR